MSSLKKIKNASQEKYKLNIKKYTKKSELIKRFIIVCIRDKKNLKKIEKMKNGYIEMAQINLDICEMGFADDMVVLKEYEAKLAECDFPNDNDSKKRRYILC